MRRSPSSHPSSPGATIRRRRDATRLVGGADVVLEAAEALVGGVPVDGVGAGEVDAAGPAGWSNTGRDLDVVRRGAVDDLDGRGIERPADVRAAATSPHSPTLERHLLGRRSARTVVVVVVDRRLTGVRRRRSRRPAPAATASDRDSAGVSSWRAAAVRSSRRRRTGRPGTGSDADGVGRPLAGWRHRLPTTQATNQIAAQIEPPEIAGQAPARSPERLSSNSPGPGPSSVAGRLGSRGVGGAGSPTSSAATMMRWRAEYFGWQAVSVRRSRCRRVAVEVPVVGVEHLDLRRARRSSVSRTR